jgi:hypothetical protein
MPRPSLVSSDGSRGWLFASYDDVPGTVNHGRSSRGQHWSKDRAHKAEWEGIFMVLFMHGALPKNLAHVKVWFKLEFFDPGRRRDPENFRHPLMKPFADTLVRGGYLADDTGEFFTCVDLQLSPEKLERTAAQKAMGLKARLHMALLYRVAPDALERQRAGGTRLQASRGSSGMAGDRGARG